MNSPSDKQKEIIRANVQQLADIAGLSLYGIAKRANISPSTVNRFMGSPTDYTLSKNTLDKLAYAAGFPSYEDFVKKQQNAGIDKSFLRECVQALENEIKLQNLNLPSTELIDLAIELYEEAEQDRAAGMQSISLSLTKRIIAGHKH
jgi:hypothetical protein